MTDSGLLVVLTVVVAVVAAVRSTWSPCGLSMLSTITPIGERGRNNRFGPTATWFVIGAVLGGASLGLLTGGLAALVAMLDLAPATALGLAAIAALVAAASDGRVLGFQIPFHGRQVNEDWLDQYRSWVYGGGFGWQIGSGLSTYIMTAAVYLLIVMAALTGTPAVAFGLAVLFGFVRGLAVLLGAAITSPAALLAFHRRFDALGPVFRRVVIGTETAVGVVAATAVWGVTGLVASAALVAAGTAACRWAPRGADAGEACAVAPASASGSARQTAAVTAS